MDALVVKELGLSVPLNALRGAAIEYIRAARSWAEEARDVVGDLAGTDSPAFLLWEAALRDGFWTVDEGSTAHANGAQMDAFPVGRLDFYREWVGAGLGAPSARLAEVLHGGRSSLARGVDVSNGGEDDAEGTGAQADDAWAAVPASALEWTVVGDSVLQRQPISW